MYVGEHAEVNMYIIHRIYGGRVSRTGGRVRYWTRGSQKGRVNYRQGRKIIVDESGFSNFSRNCGVKR